MLREKNRIILRKEKSKGKFIFWIYKYRKQKEEEDNESRKSILLKTGDKDSKFNKGLKKNSVKFNDTVQE